MVLTMVSVPGERFMHTIKASEFKAKCLEVWKDRLIVKGDIISPLDAEWDALK